MKSARINRSRQYRHVHLRRPTPFKSSHAIISLITSAQITFKSDINNDVIIDAASPNDIWFHVDNKPSCHIIASVPDNISRADIGYIINQGVVLCKKHSYPSEKKLPILYTRIKNIQKTNIPGRIFISEEDKKIKVC
jgi:predicted ribosome quality control (RQC) complex YloA/Tae2 family protein